MITDEHLLKFGKYKGKPVKEAPDGYLLWLYDHKKIKGELKEYVEERIPVLKHQKSKGEIG